MCLSSLPVNDDNDIDIGEYRNECMRTCEVFTDDRVYRPGESRRDVLGYCNNLERDISFPAATMVSIMQY